jgi:hypothetical protein
VLEMDKHRLCAAEMACVERSRTANCSLRTFGRPCVVCAYLRAIQSCHPSSRSPRQVRPTLCCSGAAAEELFTFCVPEAASAAMIRRPCSPASALLGKPAAKLASKQDVGRVSFRCPKGQQLQHSAASSTRACPEDHLPTHHSQSQARQAGNRSGHQQQWTCGRSPESGAQRAFSCGSSSGRPAAPAAQPCFAW